MKTFTGIILALITTTLVWAQAPEGFKYQAVARSSGGEALAGQTVSLRISILQGAIDGLSVYTETHSATTNDFGLFSLTIGNGTSGDSFNTIDWGTASYFVKIEMDANGGTSYVEFGTSQLLSVPYAMHAKTAENVSGKVTETDPVFGAHAAGGITANNLTDWNTAFGWGDHSIAGYMTSMGNETDPVFGAHAAGGITANNLTDWNTAFGWGDHSIAGYMTSMGNETDPVFEAHTAGGITSANITDWNTAFSWGDHAVAGYMTSMGNETDPVFGAHTASGITSGNLSEWNTAFGWGDHSLEGYLTGFTEADPVFGGHAASGISSGNITEWNTAFGWDDHSTAGYLTGFTETDPVFGGHAASGISSGNITDWNTAFGWGNHSTAGYLTGFTEADPIFGAHVAGGITSGNITDWSTAFGWGDHSLAGYLASYTETDPVFEAHAAGGITSGNITDWNTAFGWGDHSLGGYLTSYTESDPEVGTNTTNYLSKWDGSALVSSSIFDNGNVGIGTMAPGQKLEVNGNVWANEFYTPNGTNYNKYRMMGTILGYSIGLTSSDNVGFVNSYANAFTWRSSPGYGWIWRTYTGTGLMSLDTDGRLYLKSTAHFAGNVGIGTATPSERLSVTGTVESTTGGFKFPDGTVQTTASGGGSATYTVGLNLALGGYVIEVGPDGKHGLVVALQDQSSSITWYGSNDVCSDAANHTTDGSNFKDWRLPTKRELNLMYTQKSAIDIAATGNGGSAFATFSYWSSTEVDVNYAWLQDFLAGGQDFNYKYYSVYVRSVRAF